MSPSVTLSWRGTTHSNSAGQADAAAAVYQVVGATNPDAALAMVVSEGIDVNVPWNAADPNNVLFCSSVVPNFQSAIYCTVTASFGVPPQGYFQKTVPPLQIPWKYKWDPCIEEPEVDRDVANNPILNSAYDSPSNKNTRTVTKRVLKIKRNERFYDMATYSTYENTTNSDTIELIEPNGNSVVFNPGDMKCVSIAPEREYTQNDTFVTIELTFEAWIPNEILTSDPFQIHFLDSGLNAYYSDTKKGRILLASGDEKPDDALLNGAGNVIDSLLQVAGDGGSAVPAMNSSSGAPQGATVVPIASGSPYAAVSLKYVNYTPIPFLPILNSTAA